MSRRFNRRRFFRIALYGTPLLAVGDMALVEPGWLKVKHLSLAAPEPAARFVHFTDLHHKGDREWLASIVARINALKPEFICFSGDIVEEQKHLPEALELLREIKAPLFGVPGNHDYWSGADFNVISKAFAATGGAWLLDASVPAPGGKVQLHGLTCESGAVLPPKPGVKNVLLAHYPVWCEKVAPHRYDAILAGHSHGGQVRLPFYGALVVPFNVDKYELGRFETPAGPLYVGAGIGYFYLNLRFCCRPEITLVEI
jgi:predicted MPP superfamily phosphohydrolase